jgi:hypothetical protein
MHFSSYWFSCLVCWGRPTLQDLDCIHPYPALQSPIERSSVQESESIKLSEGGGPHRFPPLSPFLKESSSAWLFCRNCHSKSRNHSSSREKNRKRAKSKISQWPGAASVFKEILSEFARFLFNMPNPL